MSDLIRTFVLIIVPMILGFIFGVLCEKMFNESRKNHER